MTKPQRPEQFNYRDCARCRRGFPMTSDIQKYCGNRCREDARRERIAIREWAGDQLDELEAEYGRDKVVSIWRWDTLQVDKERDMRWCGSGDL